MERPGAESSCGMIAVGCKTGGPGVVGDHWVAESSEVAPVDIGDASAAWVDLSLSCSWFEFEVEIARSEGKTALITGRVRRPTRPNCTASDAVVGYVKCGWVVVGVGYVGNLLGGWGIVRFETARGEIEKVSEWSYIAGEI